MVHDSPMISERLVPLPSSLPVPFPEPSSLPVPVFPVPLFGKRGAGSFPERKSANEAAELFFVPLYLSSSEKRTVFIRSISAMMS